MKKALAGMKNYLRNAIIALLKVQTIVLGGESQVE